MFHFESVLINPAVLTCTLHMCKQASYKLYMYMYVHVHVYCTCCEPIMANDLL